MPIPKLETWMWAEACEILDRADRLHRQFFRTAITNGRRVNWEPPIDIYETNTEFKILIALPGVIPEHINVLLQNNLLNIAGHRHLLCNSDSYIQRLEIPHGRFERRIELPVGHFEMADRELVNGCLLISLLKI
jgi:HSP20 family molecular chaperone IbpA